MIRASTLRNDARCVIIQGHEYSHQVINLLSSEPYVIVISLDFAKAFVSVRHSSLLYKLAQLDLPDSIYNWLDDFYYNHSHCTLFHDQQSPISRAVELLSSILVYCVFPCCCWPAFCHASINEYWLIDKIRGQVTTVRCFVQCTFSTLACFAWK